MLPNIYDKNRGLAPYSPDGGNFAGYGSGLDSNGRRMSQAAMYSTGKDGSPGQRGLPEGLNILGNSFTGRNSSLPTGNLQKGMTFYKNLEAKKMQQLSPRPQ